MNSRKNTPPKSPAKQEPAAHNWMTAIEADAPCGPDLEYDPEFVVLAAKTVRQPEAQYGDFVGSPEPANWSDIDRDCRRLMMRSKDIRLAVLFTRGRTRLAGPAGLAEGVGLLAAWLAAFPQAIHPQPGVDADRDAALEIRMNALQALADADGLLSDVREITLIKSTAMRLQVRDVERAFAYPRPGDALAPDSVTRQLDDLRAQQPAVAAGFDKALAALGEITAWAGEHLDTCVPDLSPLVRLLGRVAGDPSPRSAEEHMAIEETPSLETLEVSQPEHVLPAQTEHQMQPAQRRGTAPHDRHAALALICEARHWFEQHEPSSPIPVLLRRAEHFVGKRYAEVVEAIPAALLAQWTGEP
ncbi:MAG TPA: type VI secretion system ImpA family N-terminal domain-containing protein [Paraburkholderia sp.]|uniref:type VI secretion system protein TssA n=1 Tax=Paraburkholderia sp. TaxID=1926495 RepID=UPI002ED23945